MKILYFDANVFLLVKKQYGFYWFDQHY